MDRPIVYVNENPLDTDFLGLAKSTMIGLGFALQATLGTGTLVDGLACTPTAPASLQVNIAPGSIYTYANIDGSAYGSLAADTADFIVKQGILLATTTLTCNPPATSGQSINYLIQAAYQDQDTGAAPLPYYNSTNPSVAYNGPNNTGVSQNTVRKGAIVLQALAGIAAATGSQTTPSPTSGYSGLWVVTVANGQTQITSGNIAYASGAPFIGEKLTQKISQTTGDARYAQIGGAVATLSRTIVAANGNYTPNAKLLYADVKIVGSGAGGGGGNSSTGTSGSGGGAGELAVGRFSAATLGASAIAVTIGAPGTAGAAGSNGGGGNPTIFGSFMTANGGTFGIAGSSTAAQSVQGGLGGTGGTGGDYRSPGGDGQCGAPAASAFGGMGGASAFGGGGAGSSSATSAQPGRAWGAGGGGAQQAGNGAAGRQGYCIIEEYLHA